MLDKNRILAKIDELDGYLDELDQIAPAKLKFKEYQEIEKNAVVRGYYSFLSSP